jgi:DNA-binding PadR family transcriptional regulator
MHNHLHDDHYYRHGPPPWVGAMTADQPAFRSRRGRGRGFGPGFGPGFPGWFFGQGPRASRGDIRAAILALLAEQPMHGYQIIQEITDRSAGVWTPSPGSVYPTLQALDDEGLVSVNTTEGKKVFSLTDAGRAANEARDATTDPWDDVGRDVGEGLLDLRDAVGQVLGAVRQIAGGGTPAQVAEAKRVLGETRRTLYRILAEDDA